jgi:hypothetical protein
VQIQHSVERRKGHSIAKCALQTEYFIATNSRFVIYHGAFVYKNAACSDFFVKIYLKNFGDIKKSIILQPKKELERFRKHVDLNVLPPQKRDKVDDSQIVEMFYFFLLILILIRTVSSCTYPTH